MFFNFKNNNLPKEDNAAAIPIRRLYEGLFIIALFFSLFILVALASYNAHDPGWSHASNLARVSNLGGRVGSFLADVLYSLFGYVAYFLPFLTAYAAWQPCRKKNVDMAAPGLILRLISLLFVLIAASAFVRMHFHHGHLPFGAGGLAGRAFANMMVEIFNVVGANLIVLAFLLSSFTVFTGFSWLRLADLFGQIVFDLVDFLGAQTLAIKWGKVFEPLFSKLLHVFDRFKDVNKEKDKSPRRSRFSPLLVKEMMQNAVKEVEQKLAIITPATIKTSRRAEQEKQKVLIKDENSDFLPPLSLLDSPDKPAGSQYTHEQLETMSKNVEEKLRDFGIDAQVVTVHPGPVVTRFELQLAAGTKVSRITALAKDLARSLSVISVRVVEVIPGKSVIGLELPNEKRDVVRLKEIISSQQYEQARSPLTIALGKDISGHPVIVDLAKMPHLLVAGTTGSGKSVCLNAMLLSLLYKYSPQEMRMILIDPKMLELSVYDGIPHLLAPVVTDMKEASNALRWCVMEMERRYKILAALGVRNIGSYNHKVREAREKGSPLLDPTREGEEVELQEMPYIVVIADEYADMIMVVGKKVEELIARLAQKARASGVHLVLATQRPSVDVITGLIKANISTRIAFQVSSKIDSRTILDQSGAEQLLGHGDMLYLAPGSGVPIRVHGAFVADEEVHRVAKDLKKRGEPNYVEEILSGGGVVIPGIDDEERIAELEDPEKDPLYDEAVKIVMETKRASISGIQRRLRIGYNRAARMIEAMERAGLVSPMESNGNREVLVGKQE